MVNLKENRPDSTGLARADLSTMTAPPGKRIGEAYADDWIAKNEGGGCQDEGRRKASQPDAGSQAQGQAPRPEMILFLLM